MKKIKYDVTVVFMSEDQKQVTLRTYASTAKELIDNLDELLNKKSKNWIERLFKK